MTDQFRLDVLTTGIPWEDLPQELGFVSGMTCWRRLRDWQAQGVWDRLHLALLTQLRQCDQIDWSRASIDGASVARPRGPGNLAPIVTTRWHSRHWSMPFRQFPVCKADLGSGHTSCMPTKAMTSDVAASISNVEASWRVLRVAVSKAARNWADIAGWSSARMRGWPGSANYASALNDDSIPITRYSSRLVH